MGDHAGGLVLGRAEDAASFPSSLIRQESENASSPALPQKISPFQFRSENRKAAGKKAMGEEPRGTVRATRNRGIDFKSWLWRH